MIKGMANTIAAEYGIWIETFLINPTGKFEVGGFDGDAGLTGRKIVVDAYQSFANVGGGCMNGKDPSKVDLTGAYYAREIAKDIVRENGAKWCEVQVSYAIGKAEPLAVYILTNDGVIEPSKMAYTDGTPKAIIERLGMKKLCYEDAAKFGHFRD
jgi:S-adenosylmethionine synthetase